jgi:sigma-B regulation protein RsbU (phosphoserine phosphatase)
MNFLHFHTSVFLISGIGLGLLGLILLRDNPRARVHRATAAMMFFGGVGPILGAIGTFVEARANTSSVLFSGPFQSFAYIWEFFFPALLMFALVFPEEHPLLRRIPRLSALVYSPHIVHFLVVLLFAPGTGLMHDWQLPTTGTGGEPLIPKFLTAPFRLASVFAGLIYRVHLLLFSFVNIVYTGLALASLAFAFKRARGTPLARQIGFILRGVGVAVGAYAVAVLIPIIIGQEMPKRIAMPLISAALVFGSASIAVAIVRESFLDIRAIVKRGILYTIASGILIGAYLLVVRTLGRVAERFVGEDVPLIDIGFLLLAVVGFQPVLSRLEESVEGFLMSDRTDHRNMLRRLGRQITTMLDFRELQDYIVDSLGDVFNTESVSLFLVEESTGGLTAARSRGGIREGDAIPANHPVRIVAARLDEPVLGKGLITAAAPGAEREAVAAFVDLYAIAIVLPLRGAGDADDELIGLLLFGAKETGRRYSAEEVTLLSVLANQISAAINNALMHEQTVQKRLIDEELATARRIQTSLLPAAPPQIGGFEIAALSVPSREVGGDYYDFINIEDRLLLLAIGDVSGKGVPAALLMSMLHAGVRAQAGGRQAVSGIVSRVNTLMFESTSPERFATFFLGALDREAGRFIYTNAGHNFPMLLRGNGEVENLSTGGLLLGVMGDASYDEDSTVIHAGDVLLLYTDGLTEATDHDGTQFGEERVCDVLRAMRGRSASSIREAFVQAVRDHTRGAPDQDDLTLIVVKPEIAA